MKVDHAQGNPPSCSVTRCDWIDWVCFRVEDVTFSDIRITREYLSDSRWYKPLALRCSSADWAGNARQDEAQRALRGLLSCISCASIPAFWRSERTFGICWPVCGLWRGRTFPCLNGCAEEGACRWSTPVKALQLNYTRKWRSISRDLKGEFTGKQQTCAQLALPILWFCPLAQWWLLAMLVACWVMKL